MGATKVVLRAELEGKGIKAPSRMDKRELSVLLLASANIWTPKGRDSLVKRHLPESKAKRVLSLLS